ncbi:MAG: C25 family cysteine peptidase [Kiritimatiellaeota bacterium]|nr:C25 family cysteine peptidase [Kiritimatiellota bacterium]
MIRWPKIGGILLGALLALLPSMSRAQTPDSNRLVPVNGVFNLRASTTAAGVLVEWQTESAANVVAFQVQRAPASDGPWAAAHAGWLTAAPNELPGYSMRYLDAGTNGVGVYRLATRDIWGTARAYGPVTVVAGSTNQIAQAWRSNVGLSVTPAIAPARLTTTGQTPSTAALSGSEASRLKITLRDTGLYFLSTQAIADSMGWATNDVATLLAQHQLRLSNRGRKTAYLPAPAASGLYLFNKAQPDVYSEEEVFWLERGRGLVLSGGADTVPPDYTPAAGTFTETLHFETNHDPESDYWAWLLMAAGPSSSTSLSVRLPSVAGGAGRLTVRLVGATSTGFSGEHHVILSVNGTQVGEALWEGIMANTWSFTIPAGILSSGLNQVQIQSPLDSGVPYGYVFLDWLDIQYSRSYEPDGDQLLCPGTAAGPTTVLGFTASDVLVLDVSDASLPRLVNGAQVQPTNATFTVWFPSTGTNASYFVGTRSSARAATNLTACASTGLRSAGNRADYLAFSVPALTNELARLTGYRQAGGWTPQPLLTQQIYDEFNYGRLSPHALQRCLAYALGQWSLPPTHVVLVGEGSFDYHNYKGLGGCQVPPLMVNTPDGMFAADNQIADVRGNDGVPEIAIGRLPAPTPAALSNLINKIIACETAASGPWLSSVVLAADNPDDAGDFTNPIAGHRAEHHPHRIEYWLGVDELFRPRRVEWSGL